MRFRLILFTLILSIVLHFGVLLLFGKIHINLLDFDFIETYIVKKENVTKTSGHQTPLQEPEREKNKQSEEENKGEEPAKNSNEVERQVRDNLSENMAKNTEEDEKSINSNDFHEKFAKFLNEKMKFDIYWMGIYAGSASLYVKGDSSNIRILSEVKSAAFISNFYNVHDRAESIIENGKPKYFHLIQVEGKHRGDKEIKFDYNAGEIIFINNIKNIMSVHKGINKIFMDVLSGFFFFRANPIDKNNSVYIDIFDSDKFATVEVKILREEKIETHDGKEIRALLIKPELTTEGLFKRKGDIFIWVSNDERRIPLKVETKVPVGKITAELKEYKKE